MIDWWPWEDDTRGKEFPPPPRDLPLAAFSCCLRCHLGGLPCRDDCPREVVARAKHAAAPAPANPRRRWRDIFKPRSPGGPRL